MSRSSHARQVAAATAIADRYAAWLDENYLTCAADVFAATMNSYSLILRRIESLLGYPVGVAFPHSKSGREQRARAA